MKAMQTDKKSTAGERVIDRMDLPVGIFMIRRVIFCFLLVMDRTPFLPVLLLL